VDLSTNNFHIA